MWRRKQPTDADRLSSYWNALVAGSSLVEAVHLAEPLDPAIQEMVGRVRSERLRGTPDPAFVARLERDVIRVFAASKVSSVATGEGRTTTIDAAPSSRRWPVMPSPRELGRRTLAMSATALLLLVTIGFAFIVFFPHDNGVQDIGPGTPVASPSPEGSPVSTQPPGAGINIVSVDGSGLTGVGDDDEAAGPSWSPDGSKVAFASQDGIYVMNADGSGRTLVADSPLARSAIVGNPEMGDHTSQLPAWSPDGTKIAFATAEGAVYVVGSDGQNLTKIADPGELTNDSSLEVVIVGYAWRPAWSPDGDSLAFVSGSVSPRQILLAKGLSDGDVSVSKLADLPGDVTGPAWSPDGSLIAFFVSSSGSDDGVFVIRPGDEEPRRLTDVIPDSETSPTWAPSGAGLLFVARDGVWSINVDGSGLTRMTTVPRGATSVALSPDGTKVAFVAEGFPYVVNLDGSDLRRLSDLRTEGYNLVWSPDGKHLMFSN